MVRVLFMGLLAATMCGIFRAAPAPLFDRPHDLEESPPTPEETLQAPVLAAADEDAATRSERSTNLSHVSGTLRKIQMFIKNRHLQLLPEGVVNGTTDDSSVYTYFQRNTIDIGLMKIQGVATCQYLCMDNCGMLYGSKDFGDECIFNETMAQSHYNTYLSTKYSNKRRILYLALNSRGQPRKVLLRAHQPLGKLSSYTRVLTRNIPERSEELHPVRHHAHLCEPSKPLPPPVHIEPLRCRRRRKRKKKKRKCFIGDGDIELCHNSNRQGQNGSNYLNSNSKNSNHTNHQRMHKQQNGAKKCVFDENDECQRDVTVLKNNKKHKTGDNNMLSSFSATKKKNSNNNNSNNKKGAKKKQQQVITTTDQPLADELVIHDSHDEDYGLESTTHLDWDDSTAIPDMSMSILVPGAPTPAQPD